MLPQAIATGYIHIGTITGKLNGVMPATTPSGSRKENESTPAETWSEYSPLSRVRDAAGELDHLEAALDLAQRVGDHLAVLVGDQPGELVGLAVDQLAEGEQDLASACSASVCDHSSKALSAARPRRRTSRWLGSTTSACCSPVAGLKTGAVRVDAPGVARAADPVLDGPHEGLSLWRRRAVADDIVSRQPRQPAAPRSRLAAGDPVDVEHAVDAADGAQDVAEVLGVAHLEGEPGHARPGRGSS